MKKLTLLFILFCAYISYAQVNGCSFVDTLAATQTKYFTCSNASQYAILTITLSNANDTVLVSVGTNLEDSTQTTQWYGRVAVTDVSVTTTTSVVLITGNTTANRRYKIDTMRGKNIKLQSTTNGATINYALEFY